MAEVPLDEKPLFYVGIILALAALVVVGRVLFLGAVKADFYQARAEANLGRYERLPAPRGLIADKNGEILAESRPVFSAYLNVREFLHREELQAETLRLSEELLKTPAAVVWAALAERDLERSAEPILLRVELDQETLVQLKELRLPTLIVKESFRREYPEGRAFSSVLGYIGLPNRDELRLDPDLSGEDWVGKTGLEAQYEKELRGQPGLRIKLQDALGEPLSEREDSLPIAGQTLTLALDAGLQRYFYERMQSGLLNLDRVAGVGLALNPQTGEILALLNFPAYDNNIFSSAGMGEERLRVLNDSNRPLFDRAIAGLYSPGSTIKPLVGAAALAEKVISPERTIFSPGYLDVPNPFDPGNPTRFEDWRYQGEVDLSAGIAQSSNVYFYGVGGGMPGLAGLGITRLHAWWQKFGLDAATGIDLPGETAGFLPSPEWKKERTGEDWRLGDTYNVAIGQGDLVVTPIELLNYIAAIANGGRFYEPHLAKRDTPPVLIRELQNMTYEIGEVQKGMREAVTAPLGTAHALADLLYPVAGKTGSAQISNNRAENAFFVGYAPSDEPEIAILVLVEKARQGSLNAVPIARDVFNWYYWNRYVKSIHE